MTDDAVGLRSEDSGEIVGVFASLTLLPLVNLFKRIGGRYPALRQWACDTLPGRVLLALSFGFLLSASGTLVALLALPLWALVVVMLPLVMLSLYLLSAPA